MFNCTFSYLNFLTCCAFESLNDYEQRFKNQVIDYNKWSKDITENMEKCKFLNQKANCLQLDQYKVDCMLYCIGEALYCYEKHVKYLECILENKNIHDCNRKDFSGLTENIYVSLQTINQIVTNLQQKSLRFSKFYFLIDQLTKTLSFQLDMLTKVMFQLDKLEENVKNTKIVLNNCVCGNSLNKFIR